MRLALVLIALCGAGFIMLGGIARYATLFANDWRVTRACEGVSALGGIIVVAAIIGAVQ